MRRKPQRNVQNAYPGGIAGLIRKSMRMVFTWAVIGVFPLLFVGSEGAADHYGADRCRKPYLETPEPGTCLQMKVYRFLQAIDRIEENPMDSKAGKRLLDFLEPRVHLQVDTSFVYEGVRIPVRIYYPDKRSVRRPTRMVLYFHGGGFIAGNLDQYDMTVKKLARETRSIFVSAGYRLAPEHPFPAAVNDAFAAWQWMVGNAAKLGGDPGQLFVMGSSAGGNLATVVTLRCLDERFAMPAGQLLFYPPTTFREEMFPSRKYFTSDPEKDYLLSEEFIYRSKNQYLGRVTDVTHRYLSPLDAELDPTLPPALIQNPQCDPLRDEGRLYAEKLRENGVPCEYREYSGLVHGFLSFWMIFKEGRQSMKHAKEFMDDA